MKLDRIKTSNYYLYEVGNGSRPFLAYIIGYDRFTGNLIASVKECENQFFIVNEEFAERLKEF